ncbi:MAG TPA: DUF4105 domain-containing protein [Verrucomicrobiae bacterium]|nr:DUF4105 domain-containing protein [Verrucomicrobiae bacterium]
MARIFRSIGRLTICAFFALLWLWCIGAIFYSNISIPFVRMILALAFGAGALLLRFFVPDWKRAIGCFLSASLGVVLCWLSIKPSNAREWSRDQAVLARAEVDGEQVTVRNVRNCSYHTPQDYHVAHYDRTFDLGALESVWFVVEPFDGTPGAAHTFLSFGFKGGQYVAVSVEIRKEKGESYSPIKALFKQYELMYVIGDENDLIKLRTNYRNDTVYLYPIRARAGARRALFLDIMTAANRLAENPEFYHTLWNTCTTRIVDHVDKLFPGKVPFSFKVLFPARADRLAYDLGLIDTELSFDEVRRRFHINDRARQFADSPDFSTKIRQ